MKLPLSLLITTTLLSVVRVPLSGQTQDPFLYEIRPLFENGEHFGKDYRFRNVGLIQVPNGDLLAAHNAMCDGELEIRCEITENGAITVI